MRISKTAIDRSITVLAAVAAPVLTACVDGSALSAAMATDIGAIVTAAVAAWHGGAVAQAKLSAPSVQSLD